MYRSDNKKYGKESLLRNTNRFLTLFLYQIQALDV